MAKNNKRKILCRIILLLFSYAGSDYSAGVVDGTVPLKFTDA